MRWFKHVKAAHVAPETGQEYTEKTRISAILDTRVANVQSVGVMSDGDRQHFPLQLWQNLSVALVTSHLVKTIRHNMRASHGMHVLKMPQSRPFDAADCNQWWTFVKPKKHIWHTPMSRNVARPGGVSVD